TWDIHDWHAVPILGSRQVYTVPLEAPGHSGQDPHWPSYNVHLHQDIEQGVFTKFNVDEFEDMVAEKRLILGDYGVKESPVMAPGTNGGPCTHERTWDIHDWHAVPILGSRQVYTVPLEAPGHSGQDPHWPSYNVHLHQDIEQGVFTKFNVDEFEDMVAEKRLILGDYGVKESPVMAPGTNGGPCTHESLG
ncbi:hypothetical protein Celaphus_00002830, partial [Cervus elaphus hippelaphus]